MEQRSMVLSVAYRAPEANAQQTTAFFDQISNLSDRHPTHEVIFTGEWNIDSKARVSLY